MDTLSTTSSEIVNQRTPFIIFLLDGTNYIQDGLNDWHRLLFRAPLYWSGGRLYRTLIELPKLEATDRVTFFVSRLHACAAIGATMEWLTKWAEVHPERSRQVFESNWMKWECYYLMPLNAADRLSER